MSNALVEISNCVEAARSNFLAVSVDRSISFEREAGFATQALMANDFALNTAINNPQSVINAVTNISAIGLSLNPAKRQAYLVPRDGKICLDIGYIGLLDIAIETGSIRWGQADLVHSSDSFILNGVDKQPTHSRQPFAQDRGDVIGVYVIVKTSGGDYLTTTMAMDEVIAIRDRSSAWKNSQKGPWKTDFGEMAKKTVIKRAYKLWPKTDKLDRAIHHLNTETGEGLEPIDNGGTYDPLDQPKYLGLTALRSKEIRKLAGTALEKFNVDNEYGAWEEVCGITDNEEKNALWLALRPFSDLRASIKRHAAEQRERDAAIAAMPKVEEPEK
jgi:recombination protein RecT